MKKILLSFSLILAVVIGLKAQPTLTVGTATGTPGATVNVPVSISGCSSSNGGTPVLNMQFFISFTNAVSYVGLTNFSALTPSNTWVSGGTTSLFSTNWSAADFSTPVSIPDGTVLFEIQFNPGAGGTSPLNFVGECMLFDVNLDEIPGLVLNNGSVTASSAATSAWTGTGNWSNVANWSNGLPGSNTAATISSGTVTVDVPSVASSLVIEPNAALTLNSEVLLTVSSLTLNSSSNNSATGSFINNGGTLSTTSSSVKRWLNGAKNYFISNPLRNTVELSSLYFAGNNGWFYKYAEPTSTWINMYDFLEDVQVGYGYSINYTNSQMLTFSSTNTDPFNPNATVAPTITRTGTNGWNLVGNPFSSSLDWLGTGWTKTNVDNAIYFYNGTGYSSFIAGVGSPVGTTQYIPAMQGFFVHANASSPKLTMPKASMVHNSQTYYKEAVQIENILRLALIGNNTSDETVIRFHNGASTQFDSDFDAYKLMSMNTEVGQIYSKGDVDYSINAQPELSLGVEVPVSVMIGLEGEYSIHASELNSFATNVGIYLEDTQLNKIVNLKETPSYTFNALTGTTDRFKVVFNTSAGIGDSKTAGFVYVSGRTLFIDGANGLVEVYSTSGQLVATTKIANSTPNTLNLSNVSAGIYIVKVLDGNDVHTSKVVVK